MKIERKCKGKDRGVGEEKAEGDIMFSREGDREKERGRNGNYSDRP